MIPAKTSMILTTCIQVKGSCKIRTDSMLPNTRIRLPNKAVRPAPRFRIAIFQIKKQITEAPNARYRMISNRLTFHFTGAVIFISYKKNGNKRKVPKLKITNKKLTGEIPAGFFRTRV